METQIAKVSIGQGIVAQKDELVKIIKAITIDSRESLLIADNTLKLANKVVKEAELIHKTGKAPYYEVCKKWDEALRTIKDDIKKVVDEANQKMLVYQKAEAEKAKAELAKEMQPHLDMLKLIKDRVLCMLNGGDALTVSGSTLKYVAISRPEQIVDVRSFVEEKFPSTDSFGKAKPQAEALKVFLTEIINAKEKELIDGIIESVATPDFKVDESIIAKDLKAQEVGFTRTWSFKVTDVNAVPREFLMVDEAKVKEYLKLNKATMPNPPVAGIEFYQKESIRH